MKVKDVKITVPFMDNWNINVNFVGMKHKTLKIKPFRLCKSNFWLKNESAQL